MNKKLLLGAALLIVSNSTFAGGLLTNTNQNILFLRNPARCASLSIDAVYSNPAGLVFLQDGFHLSLNIQSAFQNRKITSTFAPFLANTDGRTRPDGSRYYKGEASAPIIPSIQAAYKKGNWAFSGSFAITGGGGKATFNEGLGSFESIISMLPVFGKDFGVKQYSVNSFMEGKQYIYGLQLGATYKINEHISVFAGGRFNYVDNNYFGYLKNIQANNPMTGVMTSAPELFNALANATTDPAKKQLAGLIANATTDKELDCDQSGWGITPIIGVDFKLDKWNFGIKYEFNTRLNVENQSHNTTGFKDYDDGINTPHDIPAMLSIGVSYEILPTLRASVGYHHFFDKQAKMANNKQDHLKQGTNEYLAGIEWDVCKLVTVSGGMQRTHYGVTDKFLNDVSFNVSSYSFGFGAGINLSKALQLNVAYFWTNYDTYNRSEASYNNMGEKLQNIGVPEQIAASLPNISGKDSFTRTNKVFGVGVNYKF